MNKRSVATPLLVRSSSGGPVAAPRAPVERACYAIGAALIASGLVHLGIALGSDRPWLGPLSWRKPATFGLSFGVTLIAVTWVSSYLRMSVRARALLLGVFALDCILEVAGITLQAWRHVPSHFNDETPQDAVVAYSLAFGGAVLIVVLGAMALTALRGRIDAAPSMRLAIRAGFALLLAGLASGAAMVARGEILIRTGHRAAAYETAGFLKPFHFITLHALLVLPLLARWLSIRERPEASRVTVVAAAVALYVTAAGASLLAGVLTLTSGG